VIAHRPFANPPCDPVARKTLPRPTAPLPAYRDDRDTPLWWGGMRKSSRSDWGGVGTEIFFGKSEIRTSTAGKSPTAVARMEAKRNPGPASRESRISRSFIIGRAFARPVGAIRATIVRQTSLRESGLVPPLAQRSPNAQIISPRREAAFRVPGPRRQAPPSAGAPAEAGTRQPEASGTMGPRISSAPRRKRPAAQHPGARAPGC